MTALKLRSRKMLLSVPTGYRITEKDIANLSSMAYKLLQTIDQKYLT